jgi:hypothetical protein
MGNKSHKEITIIYENIIALGLIGVKIQNNNFELNNINIKYIKSLYKTFYYPKHSLTILDEIENNYYHLQNILKNTVILYNKYNLTNINEDLYVRTTLHKLQPTLHIINLK